MNSTEFIIKLGILAATKPKGKLVIITLYEKPVDYPDEYVARVFLNEAPTTLILTAPTAIELHESIPDQYFAWVERMPSDDPKILGTYL